MPTPLLTRDDLLLALTLGAELEHSLACQYLYAAYALKTSPEEGLTWPQVAMVAEWKKTLLEIARQEMEHLGLVNNLLTAVGGAPHFRRPNFPQPAGTYAGLDQEAALEGVSLDSLARFIEYEKPAPADTVPVDLDYDGIHGLYRLIREAFKTLPEDVLFIGPPEAQVDNAAIHGEPVVRAYDVELFVVTDRESALRAVDLIIEEGEGGPPEAAADGHYGRLVEMREQLEAALKADPTFSASRPVVSNPTTRERHREASGATYLENEMARTIADLFGTAYETMLFALYRFYARTDETPEELYGLRKTAFFPLMTVVLRPLAEMLTQLPAFDDGREDCAGPPFEFYRSIQLLPRKQSAWVVIRERLAEMAATSMVLADRPDAPPRMRLTAENLARIVHNFDRDMGLAPWPEA